MAEIHPNNPRVIQNSRSWYLIRHANRSFGLSSVVGFVNQRRPSGRKRSRLLNNFGRKRVTRRLAMIL